jgi:predicted dehydrogenase
MAHVVDMTHFLVGPIERLSGRTATMIPRRPKLPVGSGTHFDRVRSGPLVDVENEDWAGALVEFGGGTIGSLEASRVVVGPGSACASRRTGRAAPSLGSSSG